MKKSFNGYILIVTEDGLWNYWISEKNYFMCAFVDIHSNQKIKRVSEKAYISALEELHNW